GLAATLDHLLERIASSRRHEQRFASEVAHELRTPVAGLRGRAELALRADGAGAEAERVQALHAVVAQTERLNATIDALMAVARQELDPAAGVVDVAAVVRSFDGVEIRAPDELPAAAGDSDIVRRAIAPLVDNARRHARARIVLELGARKGRVEVRVRDDGPGLDPRLRERAFEPGTRGSDAAGNGAGLGLALARRLARSCGGDVVACDGPGGCFALQLPQVES
ncbi:MAG TPA: HAMP domain-containing sensor histidine kinase, partial [Thermoleophilaceae bacterium]|nr:HAMP domain-containing sensor histidine kinase [Thermoleophilaceae bacterium]